MRYQAPFGSSDPNAPYVDRDTPGAVRGSVPPASAIEHPQRELEALISLSDLDPDPADLQQVPKAVRSQRLNWVPTVSGTNAVLITLEPAPDSLTDLIGVPLRVKMANAPTGPVTITVNGFGPTTARDMRGYPFIGGEWVADDVLVWVFNGAEFRAQAIHPRHFRYDLSSPPAADVNIRVGERMTLTFSGVSTIPLYTATAEGLYTVKLLVSSTNTIDSNWLFRPNNTTYTNAFSYGVIEHADVEITSFGSATTNAGFANLTSHPNFIGALPRVDYNRQSRSSFFFDLFYGPTASDTIQGRGPCMQDLLISTRTVAKMVKQSGAILASPSINASYWHDTTTAWTSLGTLVDQGASSLTGIAIIERIA